MERGKVGTKIIKDEKMKKEKEKKKFKSAKAKRTRWVCLRKYPPHHFTPTLHHHHHHRHISGGGKKKKKKKVSDSHTTMLDHVPPHQNQIFICMPEQTVWSSLDCGYSSDSRVLVLLWTAAPNAPNPRVCDSISMKARRRCVPRGTRSLSDSTRPSEKVRYNPTRGENANSQ
jgi:hypothetical protein